MSEPGPESIPTSADPRSKRPVKRRAVTAQSEQATQIESLFRDPNKEIKLPGPSKQRTSASLPPPPEIVANVQGSSAGAGSGEFHVYKASRRREYERLRLMQSEIDKEKENEEWNREREETKRKDEEKTEKNRKRREKRNAAKNRKKDTTNKVADSMVTDGPTNTAGGHQDGHHASTGEPDQSGETAGLIIHDD
ncbi:hypothetical protein EYZ11_011140 [Aspergillus tanneri]|uniref:PRKR-interacting protein 1 n=1 Tax=Aspergillus tanneri TaxID=1220188 RepID=A0A4S3J3M2_9EURO|nr:uncharacterized protein ATNIH1004_007841 [Aspergillus tanneri]KAA8646411.1 hypothetical protein ATNIH1004_007841 [Aspergillus tanneri]THC89410.1 hypothetical protein EYZ11_011140 [Aspergillus tanneri]